MRNFMIPVLLVAAAAAADIAALGWWLGRDPAATVVRRLPGADGTGAGTAGAPDAPVKIGEYFEKLAGAVGDDPQPESPARDWPRFRGSDSSNVDDSVAGLAGHWGPDGPPVLWSVELGEGHAGPAVWQGRIFVMDYDEARQSDVLRCFSLADGRELWRRGYRVRVKRNHGRSRTVPAVGDGFVVTLGPRGQVMAADPRTGDFLWGLDLARDFGTKIPDWHAGQCPLTDGGEVVLAPCGPDALLMGVDGRTGRVLWKTPNPHGRQMSHSSVMPMTVGGRSTYVYFAIGGVVGVSAGGADRGALLWETDQFAPSVAVPSPAPLDDGRVFVAAGYGYGSVVLQVVEDTGGFSVRVAQRFKVAEGLGSEQQTPVYYRGRLYAVLPKDAGPLKNQLVCCSPDDCGRFLWTSGKTARFGLGPYLAADGKLFVLDDAGVLTLVDVSGDDYVQLGRAKVLEGPDAWAPMALSGHRLLLRDTRRMICLDVGTTPEDKP